MRIKNNYKTILVTEDVYNRLNQAKEHFQKTIGGGTWSMSDTLNEWIKILDGAK